MARKRVFLSALIMVFYFSILSAFTATAQVQNAVSGERIAGADRYKTSIEISKFGWPQGSDTAVIATGENFPDALCAAPLAKKYNAPILLTNPKVLTQDLQDELTRLKVKEVFIVGGSGVVSKNVEDALVANNIKCTRLSGADRYETSTAVAAAVGNNGTVVAVTGENFPDALSIASYAASIQAPILLTDPKQMPKPIRDYILKNDIKSTFIIGGTGAVSDDVMSRFPGASRIEGADRYATNLAILKAFGESFEFNKIYLATGDNFPDALSGSSLAALSNSPIILTSSTPLPLTKEYMDSNRDKLNEAYILGGEGVVSDAQIEAVIPPIVTKIEITVPGAVGMKKKLQLSANITMLPSNSPKPDLKYSIADSGIATIEQDGTITGIKPGITTVTAAAGGISSSVQVQVNLDRIIVLDPGHGGWSTGAIPTSSSGEKLMQYKESTLNLQIVSKIKSKLEALGANVVLTREGDTYVSLEDRAKLANDLGADMFVSIHHDSVSNPLSSGTSAFYSSCKPEMDSADLYAISVGTGPVYDLAGNKIGNMENGKEYPSTGMDRDFVYILFNGSSAKTTVDYVTVKDRTPSIVSQKSAYLANSINQGIISLGLPPHGVKDNNLAVNTWTNSVSVLVEVGFISNPYELEVITQESFQEKVAGKIAESIVNFYINEDSIPLEGGTAATP